jgi:hypothetical protein
VRGLERLGVRARALLGERAAEERERELQRGRLRPRHRVLVVEARGGEVAVQHLDLRLVHREQHRHGRREELVARDLGVRDRDVGSKDEGHGRQARVDARALVLGRGARVLLAPREEHREVHRDDCGLVLGGEQTDALELGDGLVGPPHELPACFFTRVGSQRERAVERELRVVGEHDARAIEAIERALDLELRGVVEPIGANGPRRDQQPHAIAQEHARVATLGREHVAPGALADARATIRERLEIRA